MNNPNSGETQSQAQQSGGTNTENTVDVSREAVERFIAVPNASQAMHDKARLMLSELLAAKEQAEKEIAELRAGQANDDRDYRALRTKLEQAERERGAAVNELINIGKANYRGWDDGLNTAEQFVIWAQNRARHTLANLRCNLPALSTPSGADNG